MYDIAVYLLGDLPTYQSYLYGVLSFILSIIFFFVILTPFIVLFKFSSRW